jgi:hypothetical protein
LRRGDGTFYADGKIDVGMVNKWAPRFKAWNLALLSEERASALPIYFTQAAFLLWSHSKALYGIQTAWY